jgi:hypothetical protein
MKMNTNNTSAPMTAQLISSILYNMSSEKLNDVATKLVSELGVETSEDMIHVREDDLVPPLTVIQARKLLSAWSQSSELELYAKF